MDGGMRADERGIQLNAIAKSEIERKRLQGAIVDDVKISYFNMRVQTCELIFITNVENAKLRKMYNRFGNNE